MAKRASRLGLALFVCGKIGLLASIKVLNTLPLVGERITRSRGVGLPTTILAIVLRDRCIRGVEPDRRLKPSPASSVQTKRNDRPVRA